MEVQRNSAEGALNAIGWLRALGARLAIFSRRGRRGLWRWSENDPRLETWVDQEGSQWRSGLEVPYTRSVCIDLHGDEVVVSRLWWGFRDAVGRAVQVEAHVALPFRRACAVRRTVLSAMDAILLGESEGEGRFQRLANVARLTRWYRDIGRSRTFGWLDRLLGFRRPAYVTCAFPEVGSELLSDWLLERLPGIPTGCFSTLSFDHRAAWLQMFPAASVLRQWGGATAHARGYPSHEGSTCEEPDVTKSRLRLSFLAILFGNR